MQEAKHGAVYQTLENKPGGWKYRWVLEYTSGVVKRGGWNGDHDDKFLKASEQSTTGLLRAFIEAMDSNRAYYKAVECPGPDFCMFQWIHEGKISRFGAVNSRIIGMALVTRSEKVTMLESGVAEVEARPQDEQHSSFHYGV